MSKERVFWLTLLCFVPIQLKIFEVITWPWWIVAAPAAIVTGIAVLCILILILASIGVIKRDEY